ncbi:hypothetical protein FQZ97_786980 [compost metagenome]
MEKKVFFLFKNGIQKKLRSVQVNGQELPVDFDREQVEQHTLYLKPRRNNITLFFKEGGAFSAPLLGGEWDQVIVNEARQSKLLNRVFGVVTVGCLLAVLLDILVMKSTDIIRPLIGVAVGSIWSHYRIKKNRYSVIVR